MKSLSIIILSSVIFLVSCNSKDKKYDASGNFESDEVIVSAEQTGKLLSFAIKEGDTLSKGQLIGQIDVTNIVLQKEQAEATIRALRQKTTDPAPQAELIRKQLLVQQSQLDKQLKEKARTENLVKADAATQKQLDDINADIDALRKQIAASEQQIILFNSNIATQNRTVLSERNPLEKSVEQIQEQINKGQIINPITGTVLTRYAMEGEFATTGKALYKIANIDTLILRAYITGSQLPQIKLQQQVKVLTDDGKKNYKEYPGTIYWISGKSEFTPKTIQTKDERANLVYAIKIRVKNDGYLKIGMYAEVSFNSL